MTTLPVTFALEPRLKEQFADFLRQGFTAFVAAMRLWPKDPGLASMVANTWPTDPYVVACIENAREKEAAAKAPSTKLAQIKRIEERLPVLTQDNWLKAERLIAEMSGHIAKPELASVTVNNSQISERVLVIKDHGSDEDWEAKLQRQQTKLIEHNT